MTSDSGNLMERVTGEWAEDTSSELYRNDGLISICIGAGAAAFDSISKLYQPVRNRNKDPLSARNLIEITCFYGMGILGSVIVGSKAAYEAHKSLHTKTPDDFDTEELTTLGDIGALVYSIAAYRLQQLDATLIQLHDFYAHNQKRKPWETR